ncbi:MAG: diguanylate cyclase [Oscillospiraceae bacterium]|nr:diguanylate cyclase [Oscillospiraceae bacterium]
MNRAILADMLGEEFDILEASNGAQAVELIQENGSELSLILLDIVMPEVDGFGVLEAMVSNHWIEDIPVIMISAESGASQIERAYELGATDFITRPFDALIVHKRVVNTIILYANQKKLVSLVAAQVYEAEQQSNLMIDILSHVVEFRNGESGLHVRNVHAITELLLTWLRENGKYPLTQADVATISTASALHDIGKIAIPSAILNKPGRLTPQEFETMKTHTTIGADMLRDLPIYQDKPLVKISYEICRWHHERYDGSGYPDGLKGEDIAISAQVVALADVYDALTSKRVYKPPFTHPQALKMILGGQCGAFNPILLECLTQLSDAIRKELEQTDLWAFPQSAFDITGEVLQHEDVSVSKRTLQLLEHERIKHDFFAALTDEIQFEFTLSPPQVTLSPFGAKKLGFSEVVKDPFHNPSILSLADPKDFQGFSDAIRGTSPGQPVVKYDCPILVDGEPRWHRILARATWSTDEPPRYMGAIGKIIDIHSSRMELADLQRQASRDPLTGLLNHASARKRITVRLEERPQGKYALIIFDLDHFKQANDTQGHLFGDQLLCHIAENLRQTVRGGDIVARAGGDEFLIFLEYKSDPQAAIQRIFSSLTGEYQGFPISLSMGVAQADVVGSDYDALFKAADNALYTVKRNGRGQFRFYDQSMRDTLSTISPIAEESLTDPREEDKK